MYDGALNKLYFRSGETTTTTDRMVIVRSTGKVGIGTDVPSELLTVIGNVSSSGDVYALGSISGSSNLAIGGNAEASGSVTATSFTGSLTKLKDGTDYLIAGSNITLTTGSSGAVTVAFAPASELDPVPDSGAPASTQ